MDDDEEAFAEKNCENFEKNYGLVGRRRWGWGCWWKDEDDNDDDKERETKHFNILLTFLLWKG